MRRGRRWRRCRPASGCHTTRTAATRCRRSIVLKSRVAYDDRNIYFAFHCFDNEPAKIRTNVTKRDSAFNDDWFALSLDSAGTGQAAYHLFTNPSGSQMDALNTSASGEQFDADMVWYSAAKTTSDGYVIEVQIPLQTLRFSGADEVRMGLVFFRKVSRIGMSYAWPEMAPGQWVFDRPGHLIFNNLRPRRLVEALPSITYGVSQDRRSATRLERRRRQMEPRHQRQARHHVRHHARRHDQSRLQPGGERRIPGAGESALPGVLLREAAILHGGHGPVQHCRHRRRRQYANGGAHAEDRRSDFWQQGHRHVRQDDVRRVERARRQARRR